MVLMALVMAVVMAEARASIWLRGADRRRYGGVDGRWELCVDLS